MNSKTKIKIYRVVIEEVSKKCEGAGEFIRNKKMNYVQSMEYRQRRYVYMFLMLRTQFGHVHSLERICFHYLFSIKIVLF